jgi:hypothetical protein
MKNLRSYLLENMEELKVVVGDVATYNGSLEYLAVWDNDEFTINELFANPYEALRSSYYGDYNFNDSLIRFNGYGNIESLSNYDYEIELRDSIDDIIDELLKVYNELDISDELYELIENILNEEE